MDNSASSSYANIPGFNADPQSDGRNLAALFGEDETVNSHQNNELDFRYDPAAVRETEPIIPKPSPRRNMEEPSDELLLADSLQVDFTEYGTQTVSLSVSGDVLRFNGLANNAALCFVPLDTCRLSIVENAVTITNKDGEVHSRILADFEFYTKLGAIVSTRQDLKPLIFSWGEGDEEVTENSHILFNQITFAFANNEIKEVPDQTYESKHLKMKAKRLEDSFLKHFKSKRTGAKFIVAVHGVGAYFELKRVRTKSSPSIDSSRQGTPPIPVEEPLLQDSQESAKPLASSFKNRMSKMGAIPLLPLEVVQPKPHIPSSVATPATAASTEPVRPIPMERRTSILRDGLEQRIIELEAKVAVLSTQIATSTSTNSQNFDKYEYAMDLWAQIAASPTIPTDAKAEIKQIIKTTAFQS